MDVWDVAPTQMDDSKAQALVRRAHELIPALKERAVETENLRRLTDATVTDLKAAEIHKYFTPKRYGGLELDWSVHMDIGRELAKGCGSTAWIACVVLANTWIIGRFPEEAQDESFGANPDLIASSAFAGGNTMEPVDGGYMLDGLWRFSSGVDHADWAILGALVAQYNPQEEARPPEFRLALVPRSEFEIIDNWYAAGLKGTGSNDIKVTKVFVPEHRTIENSTDGTIAPPGAALHDSYIYGVEFLPYFRSLLLGPMLGAAHGALADYLQITKSRTGQMFGESIVDQVPVQTRIAETALEIRTAELLARNEMNMMAAHGRARRPLRGIKRINQVRDSAYIARTCRNAVDRLVSMMGASGQTDHNPVQRHLRDVSAMAAHGSLQWDKSVSPYGKWALGLPTGDKAVDGVEEAPEPF